MQTQKHKKANICLQLTTQGGYLGAKPEEYSSENIEVGEYMNILLLTKPGSLVFGGWLYCAHVKEILEDKICLEINQLTPKPNTITPSSGDGCVVLDTLELRLNEIQKWSAPIVGSSIVWAMELLSIN